MLQLKLLILLCVLTNSRAYQTNVVQILTWPSKSIDFVIMCEENERTMFFKFIYDTVSELNKAVGGQYLQWTEHSLEEAITKPRYLIFALERYDCGETIADSKGGYYVALSISPECNQATNLRNILVGLGFIYTHLRADRDQFIDFHFDNIYNYNHQVYEKCGDCMESDNEAFAVYDFNSILHCPQYSIYAKNESAPIVTPKQSNIQMDETYTDKKITPQDVLIFKAIYG